MFGFACFCFGPMGLQGVVAQTLISYERSEQLCKHSLDEIRADTNRSKCSTNEHNSKIFQLHMLHKWSNPTQIQHTLVSKLFRLHLKNKNKKCKINFHSHIFGHLMTQLQTELGFTDACSITAVAASVLTLHRIYSRAGRGVGHPLVGSVHSQIYCTVIAKQRKI